MRRMIGKLRLGILAAVAVLALLGGIDTMVMTAGTHRAPEVTTTVAPAANVTSDQAPASAGPPSPAVPAAGVPTPATTPPLPTPKVVEKPPPVVNGVARANVRSAHSPKLTQQLAAAPATVPPPVQAGAVGVDVADYQHPGGAAISWPRVAAAGYKFAFVKATEGSYYANPYYASDLSQAKAAGLYATGYHFAIPNVGGGASQADYAVSGAGYVADGRTLPLALDIEYNPYGSECYGMSAGQLVSWLSAFTAEVRRLTGQQPVIYTTADWWNTCTGGSAAFAVSPLWVAAYRSGSPPLPAGWGSWTFWQYTSRGVVPGISGHVDVSYFLQAADSGLGQLAPATDPGPAGALPSALTSSGLPQSGPASPGLTTSGPATVPLPPAPGSEPSPSDPAAPPTAPADVAPADTAPSDTAPAEAAPSSAAPSDAAPADAAPSDAGTASPSGSDPAAPPSDPATSASPSATATASASPPGTESPAPSGTPSPSGCATASPADLVTVPDSAPPASPAVCPSSPACPAATSPAATAPGADPAATPAGSASACPSPTPSGTAAPSPSA